MNEAVRSDPGGFIAFLFPEQPYGEAGQDFSFSRGCGPG